MLSRARPHVTIPSGCLVERNKIKRDFITQFGWPCMPLEPWEFSPRSFPLLPSLPQRPLRNTIGPGMQLRQSHRHFKANRPHPAAVGKGRERRVGMWGGYTKHCHVSPLYRCQLFGVWERGVGCEAWQPPVSPPHPRVLFSSFSLSLFPVYS